MKMKDEDLMKRKKDGEVWGIRWRFAGLHPSTAHFVESPYLAC